MPQMMEDMDIAFPNLGIYLRNVPKTIMIGSFGIALYGVLIAAAMLMGVAVAAHIAKKKRTGSGSLLGLLCIYRDLSDRRRPHLLCDLHVGLLQGQPSSDF